MPHLLGGSPNIGRSVSCVFPRLVTFPVSAEAAQGCGVYCIYFLVVVVFSFVVFFFQASAAIPQHPSVLFSIQSCQEPSRAAVIQASPFSRSVLAHRLSQWCFKRSSSLLNSLCFQLLYCYLELFIDGIELGCFS